MPVSRKSSWSVLIFALPEPNDLGTIPPAFLNISQAPYNNKLTVTTTTTTSCSTATTSTDRSLDEKQTVRRTLRSKVHSKSVPHASLPQCSSSALIRAGPPALQPGPLADTPASTVVLDATEDVMIKRRKQDAHFIARQSHSLLYCTAQFDYLSPGTHSHTTNTAWMDVCLEETEIWLNDNCHWLKEDADLDLRRNLDDYQLGLRQDVANRKSGDVV
ncbi:hypothetical protein LEL_11024 [Akanthomyces lecanii RCEF 1005]|uniref:Uncharacterized protein n=1 Tax=Akanthomyces lecanii RCEF 1005 TaxID=1081108 RepID=A0A167LNP1_CORDF|nr:hypothetical protein LEL_11024 [Akanthomyces lecanii RCEF 1005]